MKCFALIIFLSLSITGFSQNTMISGYIKDSQSGEALLYATCYDSINSIGVTSNSLGYFTIETKKKENITLKFSSLGYGTQRLTIKSVGDTILTIQLSPQSLELKEVNVSEYASIQKEDVSGKLSIPISTLQSLPSFVGIPDLMKAITFLPGISGGKDGYSNIYVRGGDRGQNLVLLDGIKMYNTNHVGGFLSLLNSDILKQVDIYKGGFPARYGGRASSIIDAYTKDGNSNKIKGKFNIGILNSELMLEGPMGKKVNFFIAGRCSYYNLVDYFNKAEDENYDETYKYRFYDINSKLTWTPNNKQKLSLSFFNGRDIQKYISTFGPDCDNETSTDDDVMNINSIGVSILHKYRLSQKTTLENLLAYTNYNNKFEVNTIVVDNDNGLKTKENSTSFSGIEDYSYKSKLDYYINNNFILRSGIEASYYQFTPSLNANEYDNENTATQIDTAIGFTNRLESAEIGIYEENEINIRPNLKINIGLRGVGYFCKDTSFFRIEPRLALRWNMNRNLSFKVNYTIINQYNHVLVNNVEGFEREIWFSATKEMQPQNAKQLSAGFFYSNEDYNFDFSIEGYYKKMRHIQKYKSPIMDNDLNDITDLVASNGIGKTKGLEFYVKKSFRRLNLNLNYTLSWSDRKFEELNNGEWFPFIYDRRHDLSIVTLFSINKKYSIGSNFVFMTGAPVTLPIGYSKDDDLAYSYFIFDGINNRRLPAYHRLDVSVTKKKETKRGNISKWSLNIFNVYARQNPIYLYYNSGNGKVYQKSIFSILPTINYGLEF